MTPSTRLVALVLAISWLPCAAAADAGSPDDFADLERRLQTAFERKIEAQVEQTLDSALRQKVGTEMDELMAREQTRLAWLARRGGTYPASPAPQGAADDSRGTASSEASAAGTPTSDTLCSFSPPSSFVCVLRPETESPPAAHP